MKQGFIKVAAATPNIKVADVDYNKQEIMRLIDETVANGAKIVAFPELCITGYTCGDLFTQDVLLRKSEEALNEKYTMDEIRNMAFSELYGKAQAIIRTLYSCSVGGKILSSKELIDLLYVAYNRDESERFGIDKAIMAGYDELYSTSQDVYEKKIQAIDKEIKDKAIDLANETIEKVKSRPQQIAEEKQDNFEELVRKMAEIVISDNKSYVGEEIANEAIKQLDNSKKGGKVINEKEKRTTRKRSVNK